MNQNSKVNTKLKLIIKLHKNEGSCRFRRLFSVGSSPRAAPFYIVTLFPHIVVGFIVDIKILIIATLSKRGAYLS